MEVCEIKLKQYHQNLLDWFPKNKQPYPWRYINNPFHSLIAEIMLQQTDGAKVASIFEEFITHYPYPEDLAYEPLSNIELWFESIGLSYRAERLQKIASILIKSHSGIVPSTKEELLALPGVGDYVAHAVLCFAFGQALAVVDTNVIRVLDRVFGFTSSLSRPRNDPKVWAFANSVMELNHPREYNYAILDLAALVCRHNKCLKVLCPLKNICNSAQESEYHV